ncbi:hypothetical protein KKF25_03315 [Patescibacteria group bacterium]|nr:hypothetical protein [Patescibacteria group bacterium]
MDFFDKSGEKKELGKLSQEEYERDIRVVFSGVREDAFSKEISETFRKKFIEELEDSGFEKKPDAAITIKTEMAFGTRAIDPSGQLLESRYLQVRISVFRDAVLLFEKKSLLQAPIFLKAIVIGGPEVLANRLAKEIAIQFSKELTAYFTQQAPSISKK